MLRAAQIATLLILVAASAEAQELAGTFEQLRVLVKPGDTLTVTDGSGQPVRGKLEKLSSSSLILNVSGAHREFQSAEVGTVEKRGGDPLKNGALTGFAIGGLLGALAMAGLTEGTNDAAGYVLVGALMYGGIGAGIGVGVDALVEGRRVIYAGSSSTRTTLAIAPVLSGPRKGVLVSLRLTR